MAGWVAVWRGTYVTTLDVVEVWGSDVAGIKSVFTVQGGCAANRVGVDAAILSDEGEDWVQKGHNDDKSDDEENLHDCCFETEVCCVWYIVGSSVSENEVSDL